MTPPTPPPKEKLTVTWDDVSSPEVDAKLRQQQAAARQDAYTSPALSMSPQQLKNQQRTSIWYNTAFAMSFFGLLGGLLAWGAGELIQLKPLTRAQYTARYEEAKDQYVALRSAKSRHDSGFEDDRTFRIKVAALKEDAADNPYFAILSNEALSQEQKEEAISRQHSTYDTTAFIANVLAFGLTGMLIALCLAVAEPVIDLNFHGALVIGSVGATLGLFGGVIVSLFVDKLHQALGGTSEDPSSGMKRLIADAIKYGVIGLFLTLAPGVVLRNLKKSTVGMAGGLIGGLIGGVLYSIAISLITKYYDKSVAIVWARCAAYITIGLIAGLATGLIENVAKTGWIKVVQGFIAGKQFILYRATTYIGASPDCHIYLFKDPAIGRRHAAIHIVPGGFDLEDLPLGSSTYVNGKPVNRARLRTGDQIQVGGTVFTFQEKAREKTGAA